MDVREGHQCRQLLQQCQRCEPTPRGAIGPGLGAGGDQIAVGIVLEALQRHGPAGRIAHALCPLIPPMRRHRWVGGQRKPVDTGPPRPSEPWRRALRAQTRADTASVLPGPVPAGAARLHRSRQGAGELRGGIAPRILLGGHGGRQARLQIAQPAPLTDAPSTARLEDRGHVRIAGGLALEQARRAPLIGAIALDARQEKPVIGHMPMDGTAKPWAKRDRSGVDVGQLVTWWDRLVDVILTKRGADNGRDCGGQVW